jgi:hypothetical protein
MHVPTPVRKLYEQRGGLTILTVAVLTFVLEPFDLGWRRLEIVIYGGLVALLAEFWLESARVSKHVADLESEQEDLEARAEQAEEVAARVPELEAENFALEVERDELRGRIHSPRWSLEDILSSIDGQIAVIDLVRKHRSMEGEGLSQWPVTAIRHADDGSVFVVAHIESDAERVASEWVTLLETSGTGLFANGQVVAAAGHQVTARFDLEALPEQLQDALMEEQAIHPAGFVLRLLGLTVYVEVRAAELERLRADLRTASKTVSEVLTPTPQMQLEEGDSQ